MPVSGRLAAGAVAATLLLGGGSGTEPRATFALILGAGAVAGAGWLLGATGGQRELTRTIVASAAGAGAIALRLLVAPSMAPPADMTLPDGGGPWTATIRSIGSLREGTRPAVVELREPFEIRLAATLPAWPAVVPGDIVEIGGELEPRPDGEYGDYLRRIGAAGVVRARSVAVMGAPAGPGRALEGLRRGADEALRLAVPEPEAGLASGILIGLRDRVDRDLAASFTAVGASHVIAISGWNIAIVAATLGALAGRVARRRRAALTAAAVVAYVVFVGASPSVVRAAAMAGVVLLARELGRPSRAAAAIGWAVALLLLVDPRLVDDVGFRLSALATVGLIAWGSPLSARLAGPSPGRLRAWLAESLGVSLAAQLATLPVVVFEFGRLSIVSPVVNLGVVPLVAPAMAAGALALAASSLALAGAPVILATLGGLPVWTLLAAIVGLVRAGASIPFASVELAAPWDSVVAVGSGALVLVADRRLRRRIPTPSAAVATRRPGVSSSSDRRVRGPRSRAERLVAGGLVTAIAALAIAVANRPDGVARLTVLDVGQGDAILLEGERGGRLLVDGGPDPGRLLVALDERLPPWDRRIDVIILTHPHEDHAAGLAAVLDRYRVQRLLEPGMIGPGPGYTALESALAAGGIARGTLSTGDRLAVDDVRLRVLWPDPGTVPEQPPDDGTGINNVSIVLLGDVGGQRFLLAGDIEEEIDPTLIARGLPRVDALKVAHHGSRTASTAAFLAVVRPRVAVISSGRGNPYGHPAPATVGRVEAAGARVLRTDTVGTVEIELGPGPIRVRAEKGTAVQDSSPAAVWAAASASSARPSASASSARPSASASSDQLPPPSDIGGIVRYHAGRGLPRTALVAPRRLLLGRRLVRDRDRRRGRPERSRSLPRRRSGALARPRRGRRCRQDHRRASGAPLDRDDVRVRHPGDPVQRGAARPARRGPRRARRRDRPPRRGERARRHGGDGLGKEGSALEGPLGRRPSRRWRGSAARRAARGRARRMGGGARPGARDHPWTGRREGACDADRRVRPGGRRGPSPAGPARGHGAREARPPPGHGSRRRGAQRQRDGRGCPRARRRGRSGHDLGVR
ncbi:MAG: DNA internalization-related competence protein ComEC/Rec2 [Anaerolinea sp.]|nr:DNA internalization-related competence protein ComEC/Rec2 [Anaerolinea sp.]